MARYYEETACEHGRMVDCDEPRIVSRDDDGGYVTEFCPGGVRRELEDVEIVSLEGPLLIGGFTPKEWQIEFPSGRYAIIPLSGGDQ